MIGIPTGKSKELARMRSKNYKNRLSNAILLGVISFSVIFVGQCTAFYEAVQEIDRELFYEQEQEQIDLEWEVLSGFPQRLRSRDWDLHHQKLWLRFDFDRQQVIGRTEMFMTPLADSSRRVILDAKEMDFENIDIIEPDLEATHIQGLSTLNISLPEYLHADDSLFIEIEYTADPPDRGLYFVDPRGQDPSTPTQVWTLGQPEDNSYWFPTVDHPAERMTHELWLSVPDSLQTFSNGALIESRMQTGDTLRTDYWQFNQPHAPYLVGFAVGNYHVEERLHDDIVMRYHTEPKYAEYVDKIYKHTEQMFDFIHGNLDERYPWDGVYSQAPVHNFIAQGMENTTATLLYDGVQSDQRGALDVDNESLLMHEIAHHWFGNLVTAKNWANLPLNEGFANYFEALFQAHQHGKDEAHWKHLENREAYFTEAMEYRRPVIWDQYNEPEDMYDRHTYQKTGQILRMLHNYVGDDSWWAALNSYIEDFRFDSVSVDELQSAFEDETGSDLDWFFDQWFHEPGHPVLEVSTETIQGEKALRLRQIQDTDRQPLFRLEADIEIITESDTVHQAITVDQQDSLYTFNHDDIEQIIMDPDRVQLAEYVAVTDEQELLDRLNHPNVAVRAEAIDILYDLTDDPAGLRMRSEIEDKIRSMAEEDDHAGIRKRAVEYLADFGRRSYADFALTLTYENEPDSEVRRRAFWLLENLSTDPVKSYVTEMVQDTSYFVAADALEFYGEHFSGEVHEIAPEFIDVYSYQYVLREAAVEALRHSDHEDAYNAIKRAAGHHGNRRYIHLAIDYLTDFADQEGKQQELIQFYTNKIDQTPYRDIRLSCYEALGEIRAAEVIDLLRQKRSEADSSEEREVLRTVIEQLEEAA